MTAEVEVEEDTSAAAPTAPALPKEPGYDFDEEFQLKIAALTLRDTTFVTQTYGLIEPSYFDNDADAALVNIGQQYFKTYKKAPALATLGAVLKNAIAAKQIRKDLVSDVKDRVRQVYKADISDRDFVVEEVAEFAKNKAMERAMTESIELMAKGGKVDFVKIRKLMEAASLVGQHSAGEEYNYWEQITGRTKVRIDIAAGTIKRDGITTGSAEFDKHLYHHGWGRKELSVIMGAAKAGKSMSLGEFAKNASLAGFKVLYASCEVSRDIIAERTDANVSDMAVRILGDNPHAVDAAVKVAAAKAGPLYIHEFASGSLKPSELRRLIERYRMKGIIFDLIVVDYADIMAPERHSTDLREDMRTIYIDLRGIAFDYNAAVLTATQTNREGAKKSVAKMTDIAEDFNKVRTADVLLSINATEAERLAGEARIFFAAVRNSEDGFCLRIKQNRERMQFMTKILAKEAA